MPEQIYIGNFSKGQKTDRLPFAIDNDAFPTMANFYSWRGRAKRKRGTLFLGQLVIQEQIAAMPTNYQLASFNLVAGAGNLIMQYTLGSAASIVPGSLSLVVATDQTYTDPNQDGTLTGSSGGTGTINYATGVFTTSGGGNHAVTGSFSYFPGNPVMGLRNLTVTAPNSQYPLLLAFDTTNSYQFFQNTTPNFFYNVNFYKNSQTPFVWSGQDYQQFWTTNYQGALWATNGNPGFNFVNGTYTSGSGTNAITFNFKSGGNNFTTLVDGDSLWFNEWTGSGVTINGLTGTVTTNTDAANGNYIVTFTGNQTVNGTGIAQLLTDTIPGQDGIKWYDGDPTGGTGIPTGTGLGWVNFAPPLTAAGTVTIDDQVSVGPFYLVGAQMIVPFKDRLLFFSPYIQTSTGSPIKLKDVVIWSWNGTPYYSAPTPTGQTFNVKAYYVDQTGLGGWLAAEINQPIITVANNEDVLLVGFGGSGGRQTRFVYTGDDLFPFAFYYINVELNSAATFSAVNLDRGAITIGTYGIILTTQQSSERIDLDIVDSVFQIQGLNNGVQRVNSVRDFFKEWIYFSYPVNNSAWKYPTQTFFYNYREDTWAIFYENFTASGQFWRQNKKTWKTIGYPTWSTWREPWSSGANSALFPSTISGNPQGYVLIKGQGTGEAISGTISGIANNGGNTKITSINHCVTNANPFTGDGDFLYFQNSLGTVTATITAISQASQAIVTATNIFSAGQYVLISEVLGMTQIDGRFVQIVSATGSSFTINLDTTSFSAYTSGGLATISPLQTQIGKVISVTDANNFTVDIPYQSLGYIGLGQFIRLSQPLLQTKQFNPYWGDGRQTWLKSQKYLMDFTANGQVTVNIYLSQDPDDAWNGNLLNPPPSSLIYSQIMYTCPESENIGLTPANTNLQMPTASGQYQIWHRFNTSMVGDSFQIGITLSDDQMRNLSYATNEITLHGMHLTADRGPQLA